MRIKPRVRLAVAMLWVVCLLASHTASAQDFSAAFATELRFQPMPFTLNATIFDVLLAASVSDTRFESQTQFDLSGLRSQQFAIDLMLGGLTARDRLLFEPSLEFERNALAVTLQMLGFYLSLETILEDLGPPSPDINPGLVLHAGGRSSLGLGFMSFTGFGITQIVEDIDTVYSCVSIELRCLGDGFPDDEFDRQVVKPFLFSEQAIQLDFTLNPVRFKITPLFTLSGFSRLLIGVSLVLNDPHLKFSSLTTLDTTALVVLERQQLLFEVEVGSVGWRALTIFAGSPIGFESQSIKLRATFSGVSIYSTVIFNLTGLNELRLGAGFSF